MATYSYQAFSKDGRKSKGVIEAGSLPEARRQLRGQGLSVAAIQPSGSTASAGALALRSGRIDYARLFSDLAVLLNAGLGLDQAVLAVRDASTRRATRAALQMLLDRLTAGEAPSAAFARLPNLPADALALIVSGEKVARLPHVMTLAADELTRRQAQRKELVDALIYPVFLLLMMGFAIGVLSFVLVPSLEPIFEGSGREPPIILHLLGALRRMLLQPAIIVAAFAIGMLLLTLTVLRPATVKAVSSAALLKIPLIGGVMSRVAIARYLQNLSLLLENSVALPEALRIAADGCAISSYRNRLHAVRDMVLSGKAIPDAFASIDLMPAGIGSLIAIGNEVNRLGPVLAGASAALQQGAQRTLQRAMTLLTPAITIILGGLVGSLVISVMSALLSVNELGL